MTKTEQNTTSTTTTTTDDKNEAKETEASPTAADGDQAGQGKGFLTNTWSYVGKVANNATSVLKDKVNTSMIGEFNKEQEEFIKTKSVKGR